MGLARLHPPLYQRQFLINCFFAKTTGAHDSAVRVHQIPAALLSQSDDAANPKSTLGSFSSRQLNKSPFLASNIGEQESEHQELPAGISQGTALENEQCLYSDCRAWKIAYPLQNDETVGTNAS